LPGHFLIEDDMIEQNDWFMRLSKSISFNFPGIGNGRNLFRREILIKIKNSPPNGVVPIPVSLRSMFFATKFHHIIEQTGYRFVPFGAPISSTFIALSFFSKKYDLAFLIKLLYEYSSPPSLIDPIVIHMTLPLRYPIV